MRSNDDVRRSFTSLILHIFEDVVNDR